METTYVNTNTEIKSGNRNTLLHDLLEKRRSPKAFLDIPVEPEKLRSILEAARWSPSSRNEQPWRFIVETKSDSQGYEKLFETLNESNRLWAVQAPVLIACVAKMFYDRNERPSRIALYDTGGAVANLTVQALALGLQVHQMGGYNIEGLKAAYGIPDGFAPATVLAVGYADEKKLLKSGRLRKDLTSLVFEGEWGTAAGVMR